MVMTECLQSLSFPEMNKRRNDISRATDHTCQWIYKHIQFENWKSDRANLLWIKGKPGSGKSTLLRNVVDREMLERQREIELNSHCILSFYCHGRGAELERTPYGLFRSLSHQLFTQIPDAFAALVHQYHLRRGTIGPLGSWNWHSQEIQDYFEDAILKASEDRSIQIFVDALDECGEAAAIELVAIFDRLTSRVGLSARLNICFTCRHYPIIAINPSAAVVCTEEQNTGDIEIFVDEELSKVHSTRAASQLRDIRHTICQRASGVFQWAMLVTRIVSDLIRKGQSNKVILNHIEKTPRDLEALYQELIGSLTEDERAESLKLMRWICFAWRPLTLKELRLAMVLQTDGQDPPKTIKACIEMDEFTDNDEDMHSKLINLSRGLAELTYIDDKGSVIVQFIHQSVQDFFRRRGLIFLQDSLAILTIDPAGYSQYLLSLACIHCMNLEDISDPRRYSLFPHGLNEHTRFSMYLFKDISLIDYSVRAFVEHLSKAQECLERATPEVQSGLAHRLRQLGTLVIATLDRWAWLYNGISSEYNSKPRVPFMHFVARFGLTSLLPTHALADLGSTIDEPDVLWRTPLVQAAESGQDEVVALLLETGMVNIDDKRSGSTALIEACRNGHLSIVRMLLSKADPNARDVHGNTPLLWASVKGNLAIARELVQLNEVDVNMVDREGYSPLTWAVRNGHAEIVDALLETERIDIDIKDNYGYTPLHWASTQRHEAAIESLLLAKKKMQALEE